MEQKIIGSLHTSSSLDTICFMLTKNIPSFLSAKNTKVFLVVMSEPSERQAVFEKLIPKDHPVEKFSPGVEMSTFFDALLSPSLFGGASVVILDECEKLPKKETENLGNFLQKNSPSGILILGSKGKTPLTKVVEKVGACLDMSGEKPWEKQKRIHEVLITAAKGEGKWLSNDAATLIIEKIGSDLGALLQEIRKLSCFVGARQNIERADVFRITSTNSNDTPWKVAEEMIWEGGGRSFDPAGFVPLIFSLRAQLQMGEKMKSLIAGNIPFSEWSSFFPKVWPSTLEKRRAQAAAQHPLYFKKGLEMLFKIEMLIRTGARPQDLFDLFRVTLRAYG